MCPSQNSMRYLYYIYMAHTSWNKTHTFGHNTRSQESFAISALAQLRNTPSLRW